jgi:Trypsin-like peptidase domain/Tetratricopeptide repeat
VNPYSGADSRVCELYVQEPDQSGWRSGSGTLVSGGLVLTAAHVAELGADVVVRPLHGSGDYAGTVVWSGSDKGADAALVRVPGLRTGSNRVHGLRWGRLVCERPGAPVQAVGFPRTRVSSKSRQRDTEHLVGTVRPMGLAKAGLIDVAVESAPREQRGSEPAPWSGMSGAGLFCNRVLIGVIIQDDLPMASRRVRAVPVSAFTDDREFAQLVWPGGEETYPGLEPAELTGLQQLTEPPSSPASLLRADAEVVPFHGRHSLLGRLRDWCDGEGQSAYLLTGQGGQGKTRLARHFASRLRRDGWATVILGSSVNPDDAGWLSSVQVPLLIVIDYAEQRKEDLELLGRALAATPPQARLRVLLLARGAGEWRETLPAGWQFAVTSIPAHTAELGPLDEEPEGHRLAFRRAVSAFADHLRQLPEFGEATDADWAAREAAAATPAFKPTATALDIQLTALVALLQTGDRNPATDPATAATYLLRRHEANYWDRIGRRHALELHQANRRAAIAAACLLPVADSQRALAILARVPGIQGLNNDRLTAIAFWLRDLYPASRQFWGSLQPDMLAEHLVAEAVDDQQNLLLSLLGEVDDRQASQALTVLARSAARHPPLRERVIEVIRTYPAILGPSAVRVALEVTEHRLLVEALSDVVENHSEQLGLLRAVYDVIPYPTQVHGQLAVRVADHLVTALRSSVPSRWDRPVRRRWAGGRHPPGRDLAPVRDLARALSALSVRHQAVGRHDDALRAASEAVKMCEGLVKLEPEEFRADLAASLNNVANCLDELNLRPEALAARRRAETEYRLLAGDLPEVFGPADNLRRFADLATVLNNLSTDLRGAEGFAMAEESVYICRQLRAADEIFAADLARSLNTLSVSLSDAGRFAEALDASREAVELYEPLSDNRPDTYLPGLAASYNNLTRYLVELGQTREALTASGKAVAQYRQLARFHPDTYRPDLARAYRNQSNRMAELGRADGALLAIEEAIKLYSGLMKERPARFRDDVVRSLRTKADRLRELESSDLAKDADKEADRWTAADRFEQRQPPPIEED